MTTLQGEVVFVTGGTRSIGRAISVRLARERPRAVVMAYASNHKAAKETVKQIEEQGVEAWAVATDVSKPELLEPLFKDIEERYGRLDVFVCNAARTSFRPAMDLSVRAWKRIMELNAQAFLVGAQFAAKLMQRNGGGRMVAVSSLGSQRCPPEYAGLGASKAALESLARYLAVELAASNINVNVVSGGYIDTETTRMHPSSKELTRYLLSRTPAGRLGQPEDLAEVVAFLCTPAAGWIRGQTLIADGGFSLGL